MAPFDRYGYNFDGGYYTPERLQAEPGIYMVFANQKIIDIGESENIQDRLQNHDRKDCWQRYAKGSTIYYAAHYMQGSSQDQRRTVEAVFRSKDKPPCGEK